MSGERIIAMAISPLGAIALDDLRLLALSIDRWLARHGGAGLSAMLCAAEPDVQVQADAMAATGALAGIARLAEVVRRGEPPSPAGHASLAIDLIGLLPEPDTGPVRLVLRTALHAVHEHLQRGGQALGAAQMQPLRSHLHDVCAGSYEAMVRKALARIDDLADQAVPLAGRLAACLSAALRTDETARAAEVPKASADVPLHDPRQAVALRALLAAIATSWPVRAPAPSGPAADLVDALAGIEAGLRAALPVLLAASGASSLRAMLQCLLEAAARPEPPQQVVIPAHRGVRVMKELVGASLGSIGEQAPAEADCEPCRSGDAPHATAGSISYATGAESLSHTDFVLAAPLPIAWTRRYRSTLAAYDDGPLGARWSGPYTTRVDVITRGVRHEPAGLVYHAADGRSHRYPWLGIGERHHDPVEALTLNRLDARLLTIELGAPRPDGELPAWRESYQLVETGARPCFRLGALHDERGASIGLRYDHAVGSTAVLSDVLAKQGETLVAHLRTQPDPQTGRLAALWEMRDGEPVRQLAAYTYDSEGDLVAAQDENAAARRYAYGRRDDGTSDHLLARYTDRSGRGMNVAYDGHAADARAVHEWADDGSLDTRLEWDRHIRLVHLTDALGDETRVYVDRAGYTYRVVHPDGREEWFHRDATERVTVHQHADGGSDRYRYDDDGQLVEHVRPDGSRVHYEYDRLQRLVATMDADGSVWRRELGPRGHVEQETDPLGRTTRYEHDAAGRPLRIADAKGGTKTLGYTPEGRLASYRDCSGSTSRWTYDARGRLTEAIDALGQVTAYRYTPVNAETLARAAEGLGNHPGQLQAVIHPDGAEELFQHDAEGRLLAYTDALQRTTRYRYDAAGRLVERIDALGHRLVYRWDRLGRLIELCNETDQPYRFTYDAAGRLVQEIGFDGQPIDYRYDAATGVLAETTHGTVRTAFAFDARGRLVERRAVSADGEAVERFAYTPGGRLAEASNRDVRLQWEHDAAGQSVREHQTYRGEAASPAQVAIWRHAYDELGQRIATERPDGHRIDVLSYGSGHVHGVLLDGIEQVAFERDALHREVLRRQANGLVQHQRYDAAGRLAEQRLQPADYRGPTEMDTGPFRYRGHQRLPGGPAAILRRYRYDAAGQLMTIGDSRRGQIDYGYDAVGRLVKAHSAWAQEHFAFDPAGNMAPALPDDPTPAPVLQDNLLRVYGDIRCRYDERGQMVERIVGSERSTIEWDGFGRLSRATTRTGVTRYLYDPLGRRVVKRHRRASDGKVETTLFGWDGDTLAFESRDGESVHYVYEPGSFVPLLQVRRDRAIALAPATDMAALKLANGGAYDVALDPIWNGRYPFRAPPFNAQEIGHYQCDQIGTPLEITDHLGDVKYAHLNTVWESRGCPSADSEIYSLFHHSLHFQGQVFDDDLGFSYNRHRYFYPTMGRYIQSDPTGPSSGINTYAYASGRPTSSIDPLGLTEWNGYLDVLGLSAAGAGQPVAISFRLESKCLRGQKWKVSGAGIGAGMSIGWKAGATTSAITFEDGLDHVNPYVFNGEFDLVNVLSGSFGVGYGLSGANLGGAHSPLSWSSYRGRDLTILAGATGRAHVNSAELIECKCNE